MNKFLSGVLASTLLLSTLGTSFAQENCNSTPETEVLQEIQQETLSSGKCGANATWSFNSATGTLTISGTGEMEGYDHFAGVPRPWESYSADIKSAVISEGITSIGDFAFHFCGQLSSVTIPDSVTSIGKGAFTWSGLTSVTIPNSVTNIGEGAFSLCRSLTSVTIPDSVTSIGDRAFSDCDSLISVTLPSSLTNIGDAFTSCTALTSITIPDSVISIENYAFSGCWSLASVTIPDSVTSIGDEAFNRCDSLSTVTIPNSVTTIGTAAFGQCYALTKVYYGGSQTDRKAMNISSEFSYSHSNDNLLNATWIYNHVDPSWSGTSTPEPTYPTWATTYIDFVSTKIMPDITPENCVTSSSRGLIAQSLYNMSGNNANVSATKNFNDMGNYAKAIAWCDVNNIMNGESDEYFGTNNNVTREQFALILQKVALATGKNAQNSSSSVLNSYSDVGSISTWAKDGMAWAVSNGLMSGSENKLNPQGNITGTEVAVMLYNFDKL